jgi:site-specific recombinase XerD
MNELLTEGWSLTLRAAGHPDNTVTTYGQAVAALRRHLDDRPLLDVTRTDLRGWVVAMRESRKSPATISSHVAAVKQFYRWLVEEGELAADPTLGITGPNRPTPDTPTLSPPQIKALLATCAGDRFTDRRDHTILLLMLECGLRRAECVNLRVTDVSPESGTVVVAGKGSKRSGPRLRSAVAGTKCRLTLARYLRTRARHPMAELDSLWLTRNGPLTKSGIYQMIRARGRRIGVDLHPHMLRHTWASQFRRAGGSEGDLMVLGGWSSRDMLDRYGRSEAVERAHDAARRYSLGDRL